MTEFLNRDFELGAGGWQHRWIWNNGAPVETPDVNFDNIKPPASWHFSYVEGRPGPGDPTWLTGRPEATPISRYTSSDPLRFNDGDYAFKAFTFYRNHQMWLHQTVGVQPGELVFFWVYMHSWYSRCSERPHSDTPLDGDCSTPLGDLIIVRLGIDPEGGHNPFAESIVWTDPGSLDHGAYALPYVSEEVRIDGPYFTAFIETTTPYPLKHNDVYYANARVLTEPMAECEAPAREPYDRTINVYRPELGRARYMRIAARVWDRLGPQTLTPSADDAMVGCGLGSKIARFWDVPKQHWDKVRDFKQEYYPNTEVTIRFAGKTFEPEPPPPPPPPTTPYEIMSLHVQTEMAGWLDYLKRLHDAGRPVKWYKLVFGAESSRKAYIVAPKSRAIYRHLADYGKMLTMRPEDAAGYYLDQFWDAVVNNPIFAVEGTNELFGHSNTPEEVRARVALEIAISNEVKRRSDILYADTGDHVIDIAANIAVGNMQHGAQTAMLEPLVDTLIKNGHGIGYHPYFPITNDADTCRRWIAEEGYHHHLRLQTSWLESIPQLAELPIFYTEGGGCVASVRSDGRPGGYQASNGWLASGGLNGDVELYTELLLQVRKEILSAPLAANVQCYTIFTTGDPGVVNWDNFTFGKQAMSALAEALVQI